MGRGYQAICAHCETTVEVHEGSGMHAMPFRCEGCGREWWWEFGPGGPMDKEADPPPCDCGGMFKSDAPPRCPKCGSLELQPDPDGLSMIYD